MIYNLQNEIDEKRFRDFANKVLKLGKKVELKEVKITRSQKQNKALHLYFL